MLHKVFVIIFVSILYHLLPDYLCQAQKSKRSKNHFFKIQQARPVTANNNTHFSNRKYHAYQ